MKFMDWRKTRGSQKPKLDLQMETPKTKGKASSNLFKLHSLPNKYSPHDSRDSALPKPKPNSYWETNVVCLTSYRKPVAAPSKRKKKTSYLAKDKILLLSKQHFGECSSRQGPSFVLVKPKKVSSMEFTLRSALFWVMIHEHWGKWNDDTNMFIGGAKKPLLSFGHKLMIIW